jgi:Flp pilus assembly protein TadG
MFDHPLPQQGGSYTGVTWRRTGAATIEFAIVGSVFFMMVLGIVEIGRGFMAQHLLTNAARQGCRTGVLPGKSSADISATVNSTLTGQGINGEAVIVQINDELEDASAAVTGDEVTVTVRVPVSQITWVPGGRYLSGNITGQYTLRRE